MEIILILALAFIVYMLYDKYKTREKSRTENTEPYTPECKEINLNRKYENVYYKSTLLTKPEATFYNILKYKCDINELTVCPKVRMEDFIGVRNIREKQSYRGRIKSRHVDFLICDRYLNPLCGIELDDSSHNTWKAKKADNFKNELYKAINLPLFRVQTGTDFESQVNKIIIDVHQKSTP